MEKTIKTIFTADAKTVPGYVDSLAFYDVESNRVIAISARDYLRHDFSNYTVINKTSELKDLGYIKFMNLNDFISKNPSSRVEKYINSKHASAVYKYSDLYLAAYITLYRYYESFETLVDNGYINLIDTFIASCIRNKNDHPGTLCYYNYDIHKILKLRKVVFDIFRDYINSYRNYLIIYANQNEYKFTDKQFRTLAKTISAFSRSEFEVKQRMTETLTLFSYKKSVAELFDNEIA